MGTQVTPDLFFSDTPPERIIGIECEYNLQQGKRQNGELIPFPEYISAKSLNAIGIKGKGKFLDTG